MYEEYIKEFIYDIISNFDLFIYYPIIPIRSITINR